jgi:ribosome maturation factor RimP
VGGSEGIEIVDVELLGAGRGRVLRISIDRPQGVSHADCEFISQQVGTILDVEDVIPGDSYTLEVSSPGLERKLSKPGDFERFVGRKAKVVLREPVDNQRHWEGKLTGFSQGIVALEPSAGKIIQFPLTQVQKANLKFEW